MRSARVQSDMSIAMIRLRRATVVFGFVVGALSTFTPTASAIPALCVTFDPNIAEGTPQAYYRPCDCDAPFVEGEGGGATVSTRCSSTTE